MVRKPKAFYAVKNARVRASWNKLNLYNVSQLRQQPTSFRTFFQQKWAAKRLMRGYHGEQLRERRWTNLYALAGRAPPAAVPVGAEYLARHDGSDQAAGRGAGRQDADGVAPGGQGLGRISPYMAHTFWIVERRLDTAIHRAMFASSVRQARQMVIHGHVKVNGEKMSHPSYLLNPGDMFSVDIDRVLWATGAKRGQDKPETGIQATRGNPAIVDDYYEDEEEDEDEEGEEFDEEEEEEEEEEEDEDDAETKSDLPAEEQKKLLDRKRELLDMRNLVDTILTSGPRPVARHVRELRQVKKNARVLLSRWRRLAAPEVESLKDALAAALERVKRRDERRKLLLDAADPDSDDGAAEAARILGERKKLLPKKELPHMDRLARVPNPFDPSKPYETPWRPRDWMAPFAHVPRYLEVNHTICSAVYLRHPVVRPGAAEIPSPYALETAALSNAWYLRRR